MGKRASLPVFMTLVSADVGPSLVLPESLNRVTFWTFRLFPQANMFAHEQRRGQVYSCSRGKPTKAHARADDQHNFGSIRYRGRRRGPERGGYLGSHRADAP